MREEIKWHIDEILPTQSKLYKRFFLQGLHDEEQNFRISFNDELKANFPSDGTAESFTLGAFSQGVLGGVVSFKREGTDREKLRHKGLLLRMYVAPQFRSQGLSNLLVGALLERAKNLSGVERLTLTVMAHNDRAIRLYSKFGFQAFSVEPNAIKHNGKYFTEIQMSLELTESSHVSEFL